MEYTIITKRKGTRKYILFVNKVCHSTIFGFCVNPKTEYTKAYCFLLGINEKIKRRKLTDWIEYFKYLVLSHYGDDRFLTAL